VYNHKNTENRGKITAFGKSHGIHAVCFRPTWTHASSRGPVGAYPFWWPEFLRWTNLLRR